MRFSPLFAHMMVPSNGWRGEGAFFRAEGSARASRFICTRAREAKYRLARSEYGRHADSGVNGPRGGCEWGGKVNMSAVFTHGGIVQRQTRPLFEIGTRSGFS